MFYIVIRPVRDKITPLALFNSESSFGGFAYDLPIIAKFLAFVSYFVKLVFQN